MNKYKIEILPAAWNDLREIGEYIALENPAAANRTVDKLMVSLRRLEQFPLSAPLVPDAELARDGYRMLICGKYLCLYRFVEEVVFICHIIHGARNYPVLLQRLNSEKEES